MSEGSIVTFFKSLLEDDEEKEIIELISKNYSEKEIIDELIKMKNKEE